MERRIETCSSVAFTIEKGRVGCSASCRGDNVCMDAHNEQDVSCVTVVPPLDGCTAASKTQCPSLHSVASRDHLAVEIGKAK